MWLYLRSNRLSGAKFRRQHEVGPYILDFYCPALRLGIEVDGAQHFDPPAMQKDVERTRYLESRGIRVLRFTNTEVLMQTEAVLETIRQNVEEYALTPALSQRERGSGDAGADLPARGSGDAGADLPARRAR